MLQSGSGRQLDNVNGASRSPGLRSSVARNGRYAADRACRALAGSRPGRPGRGTAARARAQGGPVTPHLRRQPRTGQRCAHAGLRAGSCQPAGCRTCCATRATSGGGSTRGFGSDEAAALPWPETGPLGLGVRPRQRQVTSPPRAFKKISAGKGRKGPRLYTWARTPVQVPGQPGEDSKAGWLMIRRSLRDPTDCACYLAGRTPRPSTARTAVALTLRLPGPAPSRPNHAVERGRDGRTSPRRRASRSQAPCSRSGSDVAGQPVRGCLRAHRR